MLSYDLGSAAIGTSAEVLDCNFYGQLMRCCSALFGRHKKRMPGRAPFFIAQVQIKRVA